MSINRQPVVIVGEVLFDVFEDGNQVLGGAPFNVAWHLQGFDCNSLLISRVGEDRLGEQIIHTMQEWGMPTAGVQIDNEHKTGTVEVMINNNQPSFNISDNVAYDHIDRYIVDNLLSEAEIPLIYHGSLAGRTDKGFDNLLQFRQASELSFVDVNLRSPWWDMGRIKRLINQSSWLKINDDELKQITSCNNERDNMIESARQLMSDYCVENLILTMGDKGALIITLEELYEAEPDKVDRIVDTVGAGDAFSAVCILGIVYKWDISDTLQRAIQFAARICQQQGATDNNHELYDSLKKRWKI